MLKTKSQTKSWRKLIKNLPLVISLCAIAIALLAIAITIILNTWNFYAESNGRLKVFIAATYYNNGILNTHMSNIRDGNFEQTNFPVRFSLDIYKNNLDLLSTLRGDCMETYLQLIAQMDIANRENDELWNLYIQEGLIFETNQWRNTKERQVALQGDLKNSLLKLDSLFNSIYKNPSCGFQTKNFFGIFFPGL